MMHSTALERLASKLIRGSRIAKFASIGIAGAVIDLSVSYFLVFSYSVPPAWGKLIGAEVAIVGMFFANDSWTFSGYGNSNTISRLARLVRSNLVRSVGLGVQFAVIVLAGRQSMVVFAGIEVWQIASMPLAIACSFLVNYVLDSAFTWRIHEVKNEQDADDAVV